MFLFTVNVLQMNYLRMRHLFYVKVMLLISSQHQFLAVREIIRNYFKAEQNSLSQCLSTIQHSGLLLLLVFVVVCFKKQTYPLCKVKENNNHLQLTALSSVFICHPPHPNCHDHHHQGKAVLPMTSLVFRMPYALPF